MNPPTFGDQRPGGREILRMLRDGALRPTQVIGEATMLADECRRDCKAFSVVTPDLALRAAEESDKRYANRAARPLEGFPVAVKDLIDTEGVETRYGSRAFLGHVPQKDAEVVRRLRDAGAISIGKTTTHEFAWGVTTTSEAFGPTSNPVDRRRIPGGSSGGAAAAVAYGAVPAGLGTDTGGSVRIPAALCGVVGFKPTFGTWPADGVFPLAPSLDHVGVLGRAVGDVVEVAQALGLAEDAQPSRVPRVLLIDRPGGLRPQAEVESRFAAAVRRVAALADIEHADDGFLPSELMPAFATIVLVEGGVTHFSRSSETRRRLYETETLQRLEIARHRTLSDYAEAQDARRRFAAFVDARLAKADFLILPTVPCLAPTIGEEQILIGEREMSVREALMAYTAAFNMSGHPAISLPLPNAAGQLPTGLQIVGGKGHDRRLLHFAESVEAELARA